MAHEPEKLLAMKLFSKWRPSAILNFRKLLICSLDLCLNMIMLGLVTLAFDLSTLKVVSESHVTWATSVSILVFLRLSVLDLGPIILIGGRTDGRTDGRIDIVLRLKRNSTETGHCVLAAGQLSRVSRYLLSPPRRLCFDRRLFVYLFVCRITQNLLNRFVTSTSIQ